MEVVLGSQGSGSTRYSRELAARAAGNTVLQKGMVTSIGQYAPGFLSGEHLSLTEKPTGQVYKVAKSQTQLK